MNTYNDKKELIKAINRERLANKNKWVFFTCLYNSEPLAIKLFDTWVQALDYKGVRHSSIMDLPVKGFNQFLTEAL